MPQIIAPEIPEKQKLLRNFFNVVSVYGAIWIIFHLTSVFFFGFIVGSPLLVGIFLGIGNIWSMIIDVPLGTIQRHVPSKIMLGVANALMIIAAILFLYLIHTSVDEGFKLSGGILDITRNFLTTGFNVTLLLIVGILYGTIKEVYEITTISYLLNHCDPSEYDAVLSKYNISMGIGSVSGIILSIGLLALPQQTNSVELVLLVLIFLIVCVWMFIQSYFDNSAEVFNMNAVKNLHIVDKAKEIEHSTGAYVKTTVTTGDFQRIKGDMNYIIMKPKEITKELDWNDIFQKTKLEYLMLYKLIFGKATLVPVLLWTTGCIFLFGCWDTIVTTFFITYLDEVLENS